MESTNQSEIEGFMLVDKPTGITSAYCLNKIKHLFTVRPKIGHAGTLDSFATGLLILGLGRTATRELSRITKLDKRYQATGKLGQLTDTLDFTGTTIQEGSATSITQEMIENAIKSFGKGYHQIPPVYSALKFEGKHLSRLARSERFSEAQLQQIASEKGRDVTIYECKLIDFKPPFFTIDAHVSHGTYIRAFINDIAQKVGSFATTHALRRLSTGPFKVESAIPLAQLRDEQTVIASIIPVDQIIERISSYRPPHELERDNYK